MIEPLYQELPADSASTARSTEATTTEAAALEVTESPVDEDDQQTLVLLIEEGANDEEIGEENWR